jgi:hypothetical protein
MSKVCKIEDYEMFDEQLKEILNGLLFAVIAGIGGSVAYLSSLFGNRKKFVLFDFFVKVFSSAFAGLLIGWLLSYYQYPISVICSVTGTAGYIGADFTINLLKRIITSKAELVAVDKENDK